MIYFMEITPDTYTVLPCGCWEWNKNTDKAGYSHTGKVSAYRLAFEEAGNAIPKGLTIDHLCANPLCVNPDHLEAVPIWVNLRRKKLHTRLFGWATHCNKGHLMDDMNTIWRANGTGRQCRYCQGMARRAHHVRKGAPEPKKPLTFTKPHGSISRKHEYEEITQELIAYCETSWEHVELMKNCGHAKSVSKAITEGSPKELDYKPWHVLS